MKKISLQFAACMLVLLMTSAMHPCMAQEGEAKWTADLGDEEDKGSGGVSSPAIGGDGTIYVGSDDRRLYAINPDGTRKWTFGTAGSILSSPTVGADGTIYVGSYDRRLYAVTPDGKEKWAYTTGESIYSSPAVGLDGTIYVGAYDGKLYAIHPNGKDLKWTAEIRNGVESSPAIGLDGTIHVASDNLYAVKPDGNLKWSFDIEEWTASSPAIGSDGTIYIGANIGSGGDSMKGRLYAVKPDGKEARWTFETTGHIYSSPAIGSDGTIYVGSDDGNLYAIVPDGKLKWTFETTGEVSSSSAVGDDGTIYVGAYDGMLYAVNPDGSQKWTYKAGEGLDSSPAIGSDGTVYITSWGIPEIDIPEELEGMPGFEDTEGEFGKLHAINSSSKGLADSPWPMFRHDAKHTGRTDLCIRAVIHTVEKGPIEAVWKEGGRDDTDAGDRVIWGHFYADPTDVDWGSEENPDLFVKIWFDRNGRLDVNFFHVSVPDIEVFSEYKGTSQQGRTTLTVRYIRQWYLGDEKGMETREEDGVAATGYSQTGNPSGYSTINGLKIGTSINIENAGLIDAMWRKGGGEITADGHEVLWGHFYADPSVVGWGSENNPDLFVKIWFDAGGRIDVNFFHVSVPEIEVYSEYPEGDGYDETGTAIMADRYLRHEYWR